MIHLLPVCHANSSAVVLEAVYRCDWREMSLYASVYAFLNVHVATKKCFSPVYRAPPLGPALAARRSSLMPFISGIFLMIVPLLLPTATALCCPYYLHDEPFSERHSGLSQSLATLSIPYHQCASPLRTYIPTPHNTCNDTQMAVLTRR